jgi:membrane-associated protein
VTLARFLPIIRTFAPFVAGVAKMPYPRFFGFSVLGTILWVGGLVTLGYFFGNVPFIKKNLSLLVVGHHSAVAGANDHWGRAQPLRWFSSKAESR